MKRAEPCGHEDDACVEPVSSGEKAATAACVLREQSPHQHEIENSAETGRVAKYQHCETPEPHRKYPGQVALPARPVGILSGVQITMMRKMIPAIRARRDEIWPRQDNFRGPVVQASVS